MAEKLDEYNFNESKYPWTEWLDGSIWKLTQGDDFDTKLETFRTQVYNTAKKHGMKARVATDGDNVILQAYEDDEATNGNGTKKTTAKKATAKKG